MSKNLLTLFILTGISTLLSAQNSILFINPANNKIIKAKVGDQLNLKYRGYLGQTEYFKQTISVITDSSVFLGVYFPSLSEEQSRKLATAGFTNKEIMYKDITAFRRISVGRTLLKTGLQISAIVSSVILLNRLHASSTLSSGALFGVSIGLTLSTAAIINICLPDRPKYKIKDGWTIETLK